MTPPPGLVANRAFRRLSVGLLAEHTVPAGAGRAYAAHFALTHLFWLGTYPGVGYLSQAIGVPATFTAVGVFAGMVTALAAGMGGPHRLHPG